MAGMDHNEVNIEEIMESIRQEVESRKQKAKDQYDRKHAGEINYTSVSTLNYNISQETKIWPVIKRIQYKLQRYAIYSIAYRIAIKFKKFIP
jgi:hypothetical protein